MKNAAPSTVLLLLLLPLAFDWKTLAGHHRRIVAWPLTVAMVEVKKEQRRRPNDEPTYTVSLYSGHDWTHNNWIIIK